MIPNLKLKLWPFETGLEMYKYVAIPFNLIVLLRQVKFMYNVGALVRSQVQHLPCARRI
jgi:hypothetical protein